MAIFRVCIKDKDGVEIFCQKANGHNNAIYGALCRRLSVGSVVNVESQMISSRNYIKDSFGNQSSFAKTKRDIESINDKKKEWSFRETIKNKNSMPEKEEYLIGKIIFKEVT